MDSLSTFAGLEDDGDALPSLVLHKQRHCGKGSAARILGDRVVLLVPGLATVQRLAILADDCVLWLNGLDGLEHAHLFVADVFGGEGEGTLHCQEHEDLKKICPGMLIWLPVAFDGRHDSRFCMTSRTMLNSSK